MSSPLVPHLPSLGRMFYGAGIAAIGVLHFVLRNFPTVVLPVRPDTLPGRVAGASIVGAALVIAGGAMVIDRTTRQVAIGVAAVFLFTAFCLHAPHVMQTQPWEVGAWTNTFKALTLGGGALLIAAQARGVAERWRHRLAWGRYALAVTVIVFGVDHFVYANFVVQLVPTWIPAPAFWAYFTGVALILAGAAILSNRQARLAAALLGGMILLWLFVLHVPRAVADPLGNNGNELASACQALAFSGVAFLCLHRPSPPPVSPPLNKTDIASQISRSEHP